MNNKKLTDNKIVKALECCGKESCFGCPYRGKCHQGNPMITDALDLINRQKEQIEELKEKFTLDFEKMESEYDGKIKAEAYKECIERVRKLAVGMHPCSDELRVFDSDLDNLLKEKVGEEE